MRQSIQFSLLLLALSAVSIVPAARAQKPLREAEILKELSLGTSNQKLAAQIRHSGVDFGLTPESEERLRTLGADDELIAVIRDAAAARKSSEDEGPKPALSEAEILKGLAGGISSKRLAALVGRYGVGFSLTPESEDRLRTLGADDELLAAIRNSKSVLNTHPTGEARVNPKDGLTYVWIPPGTFQMGCSPGDNACDSDETPIHTVTISNGFWMGQTEVTQAAYQRVTGTNPSRPHGDRLPVANVSWDDASSYCRAVGMRLPTEAEWEYAARAGSTASRYGDLDDVAWYGNNSGNKTHDVAQKQPNAWGLYDMLGNVLEWVADWYRGNYYSQSPSRDPEGPSSGGTRMWRGGSFLDGSRNIRASLRLRVKAGLLENGFRCAGEAP